jgi:hypothetical protein
MSSLFIAAMSTLPGFVVAWLLSNYFEIEDYTFFLLIQNLTIGLNLSLNFGLNTFMLRYRANSILSDAVSDLKIIYGTYLLCTIIVSSFYYIQIFDRSVSSLGFVATVVVSSMAFLMANNFQQFYIGQGRMNYAHIRFIAGPKILALLLLSLYFVWSLPFSENAVWFYFIQLIFLFSGVRLFLKSGNSIARAFAIVKAYSHQWVTFFLHGIYGPLLVVSIYDVDRELVATLGIAILLSQPARMIYQFSIQAKVKLIKEQILVDSKSINIGVTYSDLVVRSVFLIILYAAALVIFEGLISFYLFPNIENFMQFSLFFITYQLINALFGPNGTLLALVDAAKYDAYSAFFKILLFLFLMYIGCSIPILMVLMMFMEIAINIFKNNKLSLFTREKLPILMPTLLSISIILVEAAYFGIY